MVRPAATDPPEVSARLWAGFKGGTGWDVGANCGQSVPEMRARFSRVVSFEPCQESFDHAKSVFPDAEMYRVAVTDHDGDVDLALIEGEQADTGQLVSPGTHGMEWDPGDWESSRVQVRTVPGRTLDTLAEALGQPDFVKVDTEGHELRVLQGARQVLAAGKTSWLVEFHTPGLMDACAALLQAAGCTVEVVRHPHYVPYTDMWFQHGWLRAKPPARPREEAL
jgi:FkbM family methyltransferase